MSRPVNGSGSVALLALSLAFAGCSASSAGFSSAELEPVIRIIQEPPQPPPPPPAPAMSPGTWPYRFMMWLPNRVMDLFDIPRLGVDIGPGIGLDFAFTHYMRFAAMMRTSGGIGFQTFRHPPVKFAHEEYFYAGPAGAEIELGPQWYQDFWDLRLEAHVLIVGAHVAVNFYEAGDFIAGIFFFDPRGDDY